MYIIRRLDAHEWREYRAIRLRALADAPDAFGSTLAAEEARPDAWWMERLALGAASSTQCPLVAVDGATFLGLVWGRVDAATPPIANVFQVWVAPESRGQGCGTQLLDAVIAWVKATSAQCVELRVTCGTSSASRLYVRMGFVAHGTPEPLRPGSSMQAQAMRLVL